MTKFIFRFESILNLREKQEEQAKIHYGNMLAVLHEAENRLAESERQKEEYEDIKRKSLSSRLDVFELQRTDDAIEYLKEKIVSEKLAVRRAEKNVDAARESLNQAVVERKTYEKLKEKDFEKYKLEYEADERKVNDQLVSYSYSSGGSDGT